MLAANKSRYLTLEYASIGELIGDALAQGIGDDANVARIDERLRTAPHHYGKNPGYFNGYDIAKLRDAVGNPPAELLATVDALRERIGEAATPTVRRRRVIHGRESGEELSALAWIQRDPYGWTDIVSDTRPKLPLTIGVNLSTAWDRPASALLYRGAAAAALADVLAAQGHSVEILAFHACEKMARGTDRAYLRLTVKAADAPLDIGAVAFALSEVAFYRLAVLSAAARFARGTLSKGWGPVSRLTAQERIGIDILAEADIANEEQAVAWIQSHTAHADAC